MYNPETELYLDNLVLSMNQALDDLEEQNPCEFVSLIRKMIETAQAIRGQYADTEFMEEPEKTERRAYLDQELAGLRKTVIQLKKHIDDENTD